MSTATKITVEVTSEDIKDASPRSDYLNPVAFAICRKFDPAKISVTRNRIIVFGKTFSTPQIVSDFLDRFDRGEQVEPLCFELESA